MYRYVLDRIGSKEMGLLQGYALIRIETKDTWLVDVLCLDQDWNRGNGLYWMLWNYSVGVRAWRGYRNVC